MRRVDQGVVTEGTTSNRAADRAGMPGGKPAHLTFVTGVSVAALRKT